MRKVDEMHQPEDDRQADGKQEKQHGQLQRVQRLKRPETKIMCHEWSSSEINCPATQMWPGARRQLTTGAILQPLAGSTAAGSWASTFCVRPFSPATVS